MSVADATNAARPSRRHRSTRAARRDRARRTRSPRALRGPPPSARAARAIAVVQYLIGRGVMPQHLVAAGFGEFQPLDNGDSDETLRRNRRIELKLTER